MNNRKKIVILVAAAAAFLASLWLFFGLGGSPEKFEEVRAQVGRIGHIISTVGTVNPQNRLEIKPPIQGRIERILVREGDEVNSGDILAFMSSTDRATLVDAARIKGGEELRYWQNAYKETPLVAPIDGTIIVRNVEPGQTVSPSDAVLVISDRLIVQADVDETDIGDVSVGQNAVIGLDAYPDVKVKAIVDHISYESQILNNVTIYKVDILPEEVPEIFRSGMSANVEIIVSSKEGVLTIPSRAVSRDDDGATVLLKDSSGKGKRAPIEIGLQSNGLTEVVSGLEEGAVLLIPKDLDISSKKSPSGSPFMPTRRGGR